MLVQDIMTRNVVAIDPEMPIGDAYALMEQRRIRHFPILQATRGDRGMPASGTTAQTSPALARLVGIVSDRDIRSVGSELRQGQATLRDPVRLIMARPVLFAHPLDPVEESARVLFDHKIGALPVLEDGVLVGIVTASDFLEALVRMAGVNEAATRLEVEVDNRPGALAALAGAIGAQGINIASVMTLRHDESTLAFVLRVGTIDGRRLAGELRAQGFAVTWPPDSQAE